MDNNELYGDSKGDFVATNVITKKRLIVAVIIAAVISLLIGAIIGFFIQPKKEHSWVLSHTVEGDCLTSSYSLYKCADCDMTHYEVNRSSGHSYGEPTVVDATCVDMGYTEYICLVCGEIDKRHETGPDLLAHEWETVRIEPTLTKEGAIYEECKICDIQNSNIIYIPRLESDRAIIIAVDISSSMKETVDGADISRYDLVLRELKSFIGGLNSTDTVGVVAYCQDYTVVLEPRLVGDDTEKQAMINELEYNINHSYYYYYLNEYGEVTDVLCKSTDDLAQMESQGYYAPENMKTTVIDQYNDAYIMAYGTNYRFAISEANDMFSEMENIPKREFIFMSDGEPGDRGSGYLDTVNRMGNSGIEVCVVGICFDTIGSDVLTEFMDSVPMGTGNLVDVLSDEEFHEILIEIINE